MEWTLTWSCLQGCITLPAIRFLKEKRTLIPLSLFDVKVFQMVSTKSGVSLLHDVQKLIVYPLTIEQAASLNHLLIRDCADEYGQFKLESGMDQLAEESQLRILAEKVQYLREKEFIDPNRFSLFGDVVKLQSGWVVMNDVRIPYVQRNIATLIPKRMTQIVCDAFNIEEIEGWISSPAENLFLLNQLRQIAGDKVDRQDVEYLVSLHQVVAVYRHKIFNGPKFQQGSHTVKLRFNLQMNSLESLQSRKCDEQIVSSLMSRSIANHRSSPAHYINGIHEQAISNDYESQARSAVSVLILEKVEVIKVERKISFCIANLGNCETNKRELQVPCFFQSPWISGTIVLVTEIQRYFFPRWRILTLMFHLRKLISVMKLTYVDSKRIAGYEYIFKQYRSDDFPGFRPLREISDNGSPAFNGVDLKAFVASFLLLQLKYRKHIEINDNLQKSFAENAHL